jgi:hypothetical protein
MASFVAPTAKAHLVDSLQSLCTRALFDAVVRSGADALADALPDEVLQLLLGLAFDDADSGVAVDDAALTALLRYPLTRLDLHVFPHGAALLPDVAWGRVSTLNVFSPHALAGGLAFCPQLLYLDLNGCGHLGHGVNEILAAVGKFCPGLVHLDLSHCRGVGTPGLCDLASRCKHVEFLALAHCHRLTGDALVIFGDSLRFVDLRCCASLQAPQLSDFLSACCGALEHIDLRGVPAAQSNKITGLIGAMAHRLTGLRIGLLDVERSGVAGGPSSSSPGQGHACMMSALAGPQAHDDVESDWSVRENMRELDFIDGTDLAASQRPPSADKAWELMLQVPRLERLALPLLLSDTREAGPGGGFVCVRGWPKAAIEMAEEAGDEPPLSALQSLTLEIHLQRRWDNSFARLGRCIATMGLPRGRGRLRSLTVGFGPETVAGAAAATLQGDAGGDTGGEAKVPSVLGAAASAIHPLTAAPTTLLPGACNNWAAVWERFPNLTALSLGIREDTSARTIAKLLDTLGALEMLESLTLGIPPSGPGVPSFFARAADSEGRDEAAVMVGPRLKTLRLFRLSALAHLLLATPGLRSLQTQHCRQLRDVQTKPAGAPLLCLAEWSAEGSPVSTQSVTSLASPALHFLSLEPPSARHGDHSNPGLVRGSLPDPDHCDLMEALSARGVTLRSLSFVRCTYLSLARRQVHSSPMSLIPCLETLVSLVLTGNKTVSKATLQLISQCVSLRRLELELCVGIAGHINAGSVVESGDSADASEEGQHTGKGQDNGQGQDSRSDAAWLEGAKIAVKDEWGAAGLPVLNKMLAFCESSNPTLEFGPPMSSKEQRMVMSIAAEMGLPSSAGGKGSKRSLVVNRCGGKGKSKKKSKRKGKGKGPRGAGKGDAGASQDRDANAVSPLCFPHLTNLRLCKSRQLLSLSLTAPLLSTCAVLDCSSLAFIDLRDCSQLIQLDLSECGQLEKVRLQSRGSSRRLLPGAPLLKMCALNYCRRIDEPFLHELVRRCPKLVRLECFASAAAHDGAKMPRSDKQRSKDAGHHRKDVSGKGKGKARVSDSLKKLEKALRDRSSSRRVTRDGRPTGGDDGGGLIRTKGQYRSRGDTWYCF